MTTAIAIAVSTPNLDWEVWDERTLLAARQILLSRPGVTAAEFTVEDTGPPTLVVITRGYSSDLTVPESVQVAYEGGTELVVLSFAVAPG